MSCAGVEPTKRSTLVILFELHIETKEEIHHGYSCMKKTV